MTTEIDLMIIRNAIGRLSFLETNRGGSQTKTVLSAAALNRLEEKLKAAKEFANMVLFCDSYGCENGPAKCLHADALRQLEKLDL